MRLTSIPCSLSVSLRSSVSHACLNSSRRIANHEQRTTSTVRSLTTIPTSEANQLRRYICGRRTSRIVAMGYRRTRRIRPITVAILRRYPHDHALFQRQSSQSAVLSRNAEQSRLIQRIRSKTWNPNGWEKSQRIVKASNWFWWH